MTNLRITIGLCVVVCCVYLVQSKREFTVLIEKINFDSDQEFLNFSGKIRKSDEGVNLVDLSIDIHHDVEAKVFVRIVNYKGNSDFI